MKKVLAIILVAVMLAVTASAMHHAEDADTTTVWRDDKSTVKHSFDTLFVDGLSQMELQWANDGSAAKVLSNHPLTTAEEVPDGMYSVVNTIALRGWVGMNKDNYPEVSISEVGYYVNDDKSTYVKSGILNPVLEEIEKQVYDAGGEYRFEGLTVTVTGITEPTLFTLCVKGTDGELYDFGEFSINGQYVPGQAGVVLVGDIDGDGTINNKDVVSLFRYISSHETGADLDVYDVNQDGKLNNKDVVALFRLTLVA